MKSFFHQNVVTHSHDGCYSPTSAIEGEYTDTNIAVQENECICFIMFCAYLQH